MSIDRESSCLAFAMVSSSLYVPSGSVVSSSADSLGPVFVVKALCRWPSDCFALDLRMALALAHGSQKKV